MTGEGRGERGNDLSLATTRHLCDNLRIILQCIFISILRGSEREDKVAHFLATEPVKPPSRRLMQRLRLSDTLSTAR